MVYLVFCIYGCIVDIYIMSVDLNFWNVFSFFVQVYITKIVTSFTRALYSIKEDRLVQMRQPDFTQHATYGGEQVRAYYY
mmetsp:Transcript_48632/g.62428  ORF Transcript_48632/g.62428 Transcript_48632/m.62428 type:complete len:80 (+) Transcript_48632:188-427(+)